MHLCSQDWAAATTIKALTDIRSKHLVGVRLTCSVLYSSDGEMVFEATDSFSCLA